LKTVLDYNFTAVFENTTPSGLTPNHTVKNDSSSLGLLAVLAHEIGHLKWHRDNIYASLSCYYDNFVGPSNSWNADQLLAQSVVRFWHPPFDDPDAAGAPGKRASHAVAAPDPHTPGLNRGQVRSLYAMGFVSAIAGISPEEDFVETYAVLTVLNTRVGTSPTISLSISGGMSINIAVPNDRSQSKRDCIEPALINFP
jgi:hypothetical protein